MCCSSHEVDQFYHEVGGIVALKWASRGGWLDWSPTYSSTTWRTDQ